MIRMAKNKPITKINELSVKSFNDTYCKPRADCGIAALPIRSRKAANGAQIGLIDLTKILKYDSSFKTVKDAALHHLDIHVNESDTFVMWCFTHNTFKVVKTRHAASMGGMQILSGAANKNALTAHQKAQTKTLKAGWCEGCCSARIASL